LALVSVEIAIEASQKVNRRASSEPLTKPYDLVPFHFSEVAGRPRQQPGGRANSVGAEFALNGLSAGLLIGLRKVGSCQRTTLDSS